MDPEEQSPQVFNNLLFPKVFQTFRMAIQPSKLTIALTALVTICLAGWIMDFGKTVVATPGSQGRITELQIYLTSPDQVVSYVEKYKQDGSRTGVFSALWPFARERFHGALRSLFEFNMPAVAANISDYFVAARWALRYHFIYSVIFFAIILAVISVAGGGICRITALQFARGEKPGLSESLRFSAKRFLTFFAAPLFPVLIVIIIGLFIFILGLIGRIPWGVGQFIMALFMPLTLIGGVMVAIVLVGTVAGFNLMFPAVAYDGSDFLDAMARAWHYVYKKPWRMGFYTGIAIVYGAICYTFVRFFAFLLFWSSRWFLRFGLGSGEEADRLAAIWPEPSFMDLLGSSTLTAANWLGSVAAFLIFLSLLVVVGLLVSFVISFYFTANTIIYSLMRNRVDNTALNDVYTNFDDVEAEPTTTEAEQSQQQPDSET